MKIEGHICLYSYCLCFIYYNEHRTSCIVTRRNIVFERSLFMLILFPKAFVWQKQSSLEEKASYVYYRLVRNFTELRTKRPCYVPTGRKVTYQPILRYVPNTEIINFIQLIVQVGTPYIYQTNRWCVYYSKLVCFWCHPITIRRLFTYYTENKKSQI